jgi:hypothetical protein
MRASNFLDLGMKLDSRLRGMTSMGGLPPLICLHRVARSAGRRGLAVIMPAADQEHCQQNRESNCAQRPNGIAIAVRLRRHGTSPAGELPRGKAGTGAMVPAVPPVRSIG